MTRTIDELLEAILDISRELDAAEPGTRRHADLTAQRDQLREEARTISDGLRHPRSVETEIAMLEQRLADIEKLQITKGHSEKYLSTTIQDPSAYSANINRMLEAQHAAEVGEITARLDRLRSSHPGADTT